MSEKKENWGSKMGFILASAGSAVGLGNLWRFTYKAGQFGGGWYILAYIGAVLFVALPILMAEMAIGKASDGLGSVSIIKSIMDKTGNKNGFWKLLPIVGILATTVIMFYYPVIGGWSVSYTVGFFTGQFSHVDPAKAGDFFGGFISNPSKTVIWYLAFDLIVFVVMAFGIQNGIEKASKIMMPMLLGILVFFIGYAIVTKMDLFLKTLSFLFIPKKGTLSLKTIHEAIAQAFYSIGVGIMLYTIYASYLKDDDEIVKPAIYTAFLDTLVALLAGIAIFPIVFFVGADVSEGAGVVFVSLVKGFLTIPFGSILGGIFFLAVVFAALTSAFSIIEVPISSFEKLIANKVENIKTRRLIATATVLTFVFVVGLLTVFSLDPNSPISTFVKNLKVGIFSAGDLIDLFDHVLNELLIPLGSILTCLFFSFMLDEKLKASGLGIDLEKIRTGIFKLAIILLRYVLPVVVLALTIYVHVSFYIKK